MLSIKLIETFDNKIYVNDTFINIQNHFKKELIPYFSNKICRKILKIILCESVNTKKYFISSFLVG